MNTPVEILPLTRQPRDVMRFLKVSYEIYRGDPVWVAPLLMDVKKVFTDENPFFEHAEMALWVARRDGRDAGRIAGILDRNHNLTQKDNAAFFGFFECVNDPAVSRALFDAFFAWARGHGARRALGPMNPTMNDECGLLIDGFDRPPVMMMTYNPRYYIGLMEAEGLAKTKDLLAFLLDVPKFPFDRMGRIAEITRKRNPELTVRPIRKSTINEDLAKVKEVYNAAWEANWGFVPMTDAEIDFMASRLKPLLVEGLLWVAETPAEPVGFLLTMPDFNAAIQPLRGRLLTPRLLGALPYFLGWKSPQICRVVTLGVKAAHRNRGIEATMLYECSKTARKKGYAQAEASWILENNTMMCRLLEAVGARVYKTYRLYERAV